MPGARRWNSPSINLISVLTGAGTEGLLLFQLVSAMVSMYREWR